MILVIYTVLSQLQILFNIELFPPNLEPKSCGCDKKVLFTTQFEFCLVGALVYVDEDLISACRKAR